MVLGATLARYAATGIVLLAFSAGASAQYRSERVPGTITDQPLRPPMPVGLQDAASERAVSQSAWLPAAVRPETGPAMLQPQFRRALVPYPSHEPAGTIIIDTQNTFLYLVLERHQAMRYGIGVGREGFTWSGAERISRMAE